MIDNKFPPKNYGDVVSIAGRLTDRHVGGLAVRTGPQHFGPIAEVCAAGEVRMYIDRTFTLDEVPQALTYVGEGRPLGKVVVTPYPLQREIAACRLNRVPRLCGGTLWTAR